jgi:predicted pyridoxine 5'-phosphate oxidase superfamily flavin-nucleotide-binding protein
MKRAGKPVRNFAELAYSAAVQAMQTHLGVRAENAEIEREDGNTEIAPALAEFLATRNSFYLATASAAGQPYIQHRGGPAGFLKVVDPKTLGFFDVKGNDQYVTLGNLSENPRAVIFVTDYARRRRLKIWGEAEIVDAEAGAPDRAFIATVTPDTLNQRQVPRAIRFRVAAWDLNCPQFIPQLFSVDEVEAALESSVAMVTRELRGRVKGLEAEVKRLKAGKRRMPKSK